MALWPLTDEGRPYTTRAGLRTLPVESTPLWLA